jgi:hypothetical protein
MSELGRLQDSFIALWQILPHVVFGQFAGQAAILGANACVAQIVESVVS